MVVLSAARRGDGFATASVGQKVDEAIAAFGGEAAEFLDHDVA